MYLSCESLVIMRPALQVTDEDAERDIYTNVPLFLDPLDLRADS